MRALWILLAAALAGRLVLAFATVGHEFDVMSFLLTNHALSDGNPLDLYEQVAYPPRWPYPPGYLPWVWAAPRIAHHTGLPFSGVIQVPAVLADVALAGLAAAMLPRSRALAGAALIALSPILIADSSYHGQIDSVPTLAALAGAWLWTRPERRALPAAALLGLAIAIKQPLALVVVALLPSARSLREAGTLVAVAASVPLLMLLPFLAAEPRATIDNLTYTGLVGLGGLAVVVEPSLARRWLEPEFDLKPSRIMELNRPLQVAVLAAVLAVAARARDRPLQVVAFAFLAVYSFTIPWSHTYLVWGIPFLVVARQWWVAGAMTVLGLVIVVIVYTLPHRGGLVTVHTAAVIAMWFVTAGGAILLARDLLVGVRSDHGSD